MKKVKAFIQRRFLIGYPAKCASNPASA